MVENSFCFTKIMQPFKATNQKFHSITHRQIARLLTKFDFEEGKFFWTRHACKISIPFSITWLMTEVRTRLIRAPSPARCANRMNTSAESLWKKRWNSMRPLARNYLEETGMLHWSFAAVIFTFLMIWKRWSQEKCPRQNFVFADNENKREQFNSDKKKGANNSIT